jgi:hypothetical protein
MGVFSFDSRLFFYTAFILLYPAYFFYHVAHAYSIVPEDVAFVLKGIYGPLSLLVVFFFALFSLYSLSSRIFDKGKIFLPRLDMTSIVFMVYLFWAFLYISYHWLFAAKVYTDLASVQLMQFLILQVSSFVLGLFIVFKKDKWSSMLWVFWFGMVLITFFHIHPVKLTMHETLAQKATANGYGGISTFEGGVATYQGFSRSLLMTTFILLSLIKYEYFRLAVAFITAVTLFFVGGRSELVGFCFGVFVIEVMFSLKKPRYALVLVALCCTFVLLVFFNASHLAKFLDGSRMLGLFSLETDGSWGSRGQYSQIAINTIINNPIWGDFGSHFKVGEFDGGAYSHNILSVWVTLGLPGFCLIAFLVFNSFGYSLRSFYRDAEFSPDLNFSLMVSAAMVPLIIFSKSGFTEWFALAFGVVAAIKIKKDGAGVLSK